MPVLTDWATAEANCQNMSAHLASSHSKVENEFIYNLSPNPLNSRWLGGRMQPENRPSTAFTTILFTDGSTYNDFSSEYVPCTADTCLWRNNEPNNQGGIENCLSTGNRVDARNPAGWNDADCSVRKYSVCERPGRAATVTCVRESVCDMRVYVFVYVC